MTYTSLLGGKPAKDTLYYSVNFGPVDWTNWHYDQVKLVIAELKRNGFTIPRRMEGYRGFWVQW